MNHVLAGLSDITCLHARSQFVLYTDLSWLTVSTHIYKVSIGGWREMLIRPIQHAAFISLKLCNRWMRFRLAPTCGICFQCGNSTTSAYYKTCVPGGVEIHDTMIQLAGYHLCIPNLPDQANRPSQVAHCSRLAGLKCLACATRRHPDHAKTKTLSSPPAPSLCTRVCLSPPLRSGATHSTTEKKRKISQRKVS